MTGFRAGSPQDAAAIVEVEEATNTVAFAHIFSPASKFPFPTAELRREWDLRLRDADVEVLVAEDQDHLVGYVARRGAEIRHLLVSTSHWGRGLARTALDLALAQAAEEGHPQARLWCLTRNERARGLYEHLGWRLTGERSASPHPPYPELVRYVLELSRVGAAGAGVAP